MKSYDLAFFQRRGKQKKVNSSNLKILNYSYSCLSPQVPPLFGKRSDICQNILPIIEAPTCAAEKVTRGFWTLVIFILTALVL